MKKKIYFTISSILQILGNLYIIINASNIIQTLIESISDVYSMFPADLQERVFNLFNKSGVPFLDFLSSVGIILNVFTIYFAFTNKILKKKGLVIAFSLICFFTSVNTISTLLSIINFIVILCLKRKNPEDYPDKEKKEIPNLEYEKPTKKELILSIILIVCYFSAMFLTDFIPEDIPFVMAVVIDILIYAVLFILAIIAFKDRLKRDLKLFKDNTKAYFTFVLPKLGIMYIAFLIISWTTVAIAQKATSENQAMLEEMPKWFLIPAAVIWAPVVEELIFRGVIRRFIKNKMAFVIVSALTFGLLHTMSEGVFSNVFIMAMPYATLGGFFAYIYAKTDNLCNNMLMHSFHNAVAMILMNLLMFTIV